MSVPDVIMDFAQELGGYRSERWPSPVDGAALEMPCSREGTVGSNPTLSAIVPEH